MWFSPIWVVVATVTLLLLGVAWGRWLRMAASLSRETGPDDASQRPAAGAPPAGGDNAARSEEGPTARNSPGDLGDIASWCLLGWAALVILIPVGLALQLTGPGLRGGLLLLCALVQGGLLCGASACLGRRASVAEIGNPAVESSATRPVVEREGHRVE